MKKRYYLTLSCAMCFLALFIASLGSAQQQRDRFVSITIRDASNERPIEGATVVDQSNQKSYATDTAGVVQIILSELPCELFVQRLGFIAETAVVQTDVAQTIYLVPNIDRLEEVVINTGYQELQMERVTGAYTVIDTERLQLQQSAGLLNRLDGITNAVVFDRDPNRPEFTVRGLSSIKGPMQPLIVLDNFPFEGDIESINPNSIESVVILKDAAATSIWGARAGNGVVVITTKKGSYNTKPVVSMVNSVSIQQKPNLYYLKSISPNDFIEAEKFLFDQGRYIALETSPNHSLLSPVVEILISERDGAISPAEAESKLDALRSQDLRREYNRYMYGQAIERQHAVNISGGSGFMSYFLAFGHDHSKTSLADKQRRYNVDIGSRFMLSPNLNIDARITINESRITSGKTGFPINEDNRFPYLTLMDGNQESVPWYTYRQPFIDTFHNDKLLDWRYYPLEDYQYDRTESRTGMVHAGLDVGYTIIDGLVVNAKYNYLRQTGHDLTMREQESFYARDWINMLTQVDPNTGEVTRPIPLGGMRTSMQKIMEAHQGRIQFNYSKQIGLHSLNGIVGGEVAQRLTQGESHNKYGIDDEVLAFARNIDYATRFPLLIGNNALTIPSGLILSELLNRNFSVFSNISYSYDRRYTMYASARKDATNYFGVRTNNRGVPLWAAGVAWNIHAEPFFYSRLVDVFKFRASYGFSGNSDNLRSALTHIMHLGSSSNTGLNRAAIVQFPNPELRWERVKTINAGMDLSLWNGKLSGSVDGYQKYGIDLFGDEIADYTNGIGMPRIERNVASISGKGIDVVLRSHITKGLFTYSPELNVNWNIDKITDYYSPFTRIAEYLNRGNRISGMEGKSVYGITAYRWAGLDPKTGQSRGYLEGVTSSNYNAIAQSPSTIGDLVYVGPVRPRWFGNFIQMVSYNRFSAIVNLQFKMGHYFMRNSVNYSSLVNRNIGHEDFAYRWRQPGDEQKTNVPVFDYPVTSASVTFYQNAEIHAVDASHVRLQFVNLSYELISPSNLKQRRSWENMKIFINASNIGLLWRANPYAMDPDYVSTMPLPFRILMGFNVKF